MIAGVLKQKGGVGTTTPAEPRDADREVPALEPVEPIKRFTIDVPVSLHTRIKTQCAMRGVKMADVLREMMEREFPKA